MKNLLVFRVVIIIVLLTMAFGAPVFAASNPEGVPYLPFEEVPGPYPGTVWNEKVSVDGNGTSIQVLRVLKSPEPLPASSFMDSIWDPSVWPSNGLAGSVISEKAINGETVYLFMVYVVVENPSGNAVEDPFFVDFESTYTLTSRSVTIQGIEGIQPCLAYSAFMPANTAPPQPWYIPKEHLAAGEKNEGWLMCVAYEDTDLYSFEIKAAVRNSYGNPGFEAVAWKRVVPTAFGEGVWLKDIPVKYDGEIVYAGDVWATILSADFYLGEDGFYKLYASPYYYFPGMEDYEYWTMTASLEALDELEEGQRFNIVEGPRVNVGYHFEFGVTVETFVLSFEDEAVNSSATTGIVSSNIHRPAYYLDATAHLQHKPSEVYVYFANTPLNTEKTGLPVWKSAVTGHTIIGEAPGVCNAYKCVSRHEESGYSAEYIVLPQGMPAAGLAIEGVEVNNLNVGISTITDTVQNQPMNDPVGASKEFGYNSLLITNVMSQGSAPYFKLGYVDQSDNIIFGLPGDPDLQEGKCEHIYRQTDNMEFVCVEISDTWEHVLGVPEIYTVHASSYYVEELRNILNNNSIIILDTMHMIAWEISDVEK